MKEAEQVLTGFSPEQIEAYKHNLSEVENFLLEEGYWKGEMALIGYLLFEKHKEECLDLHRLSSGIHKTLQEAEEILNKVKTIDNGRPLEGGK